MPDEVAKVECRHWADSVGVQFEAVYGFKFLDTALNEVGRSETKINETSLKTIIECINKDWADGGKSTGLADEDWNFDGNS